MIFLFLYVVLGLFFLEKYYIPYIFGHERLIEQRIEDWILFVFVSPFVLAFWPYFVYVAWNDTFND